jgi:phosphomannomutase
VTIRFGTDGWRALIADEYTFANVECVAQAYADYLRDHDLGGDVLVGYDLRFLSERFAERAAEVIAGNGRSVHLLDRPTPTPVVSWMVEKEEMAGGVVITASHNPAQFNGFKIKERPGRSAAPETVREVEARLFAQSPRRQQGGFRLVAPNPGYESDIGELVDLAMLRAAGATIVADAMHGSAGAATERLLAGGSTKVVSIRNTRDPYFGGVNPEPIAPNLAALADAVRSNGALLGLATDGDADRLGALDENGAFLTSHLVLSILVLHLAKNRKLRGAVIKTVSQSRLVDRIAADLGLEVRETPIGFKYVAEEMAKGDVLVGGEESGGIGVRGYIPERDGVLSGLLLAEAIVASDMTPSRLVADIQDRYGPLYYDRRDFHVRPEEGIPLVQRIGSDPPSAVAGDRVTAVTTLDGTKFSFEDESWLLLRQSGTEPVLRVYSEATSERKRDGLLAEGAALVGR